MSDPCSTNSLPIAEIRASRGYVSAAAHARALPLGRLLALSVTPGNPYASNGCILGIRSGRGYEPIVVNGSG
ncbi:hypothetical protein XELAEV_18001969mg [Xenopus laevis]|uniref:Uncharacterized protein n=1 Tax=Xenopus laevis TaxID=8355 RepID=A0A974BQ85_XENLA|nr:hypothetical protein XELAEV_18001969mg [Xenopus laevis]